MPSVPAGSEPLLRSYIRRLEHQLDLEVYEHLADDDLLTAEAELLQERYALDLAELTLRIRITATGDLPVKAG